MDTVSIVEHGPCEWHIPAQGRMTVPVVIYATRELVRDMDDRVREQAVKVAALPGIVGASYVMPDAHGGHGFPMGAVAAFDAGLGGVVSAGGVGMDVSCGIRCLHTGLTLEDIEPVKRKLADALFAGVPGGPGGRGAVRLDDEQMNEMLLGGARWAVDHDWGTVEDLERIEDRGQVAHANPACVPEHAKRRQRDEMGTLGGGHHYLEVQEVTEVFAARTAQAFGLGLGDIVVTLHSGSNGLGYQIGADYQRLMAESAGAVGLSQKDRELASVPLASELGRRYLGAMRAAINCALANRQMLTHKIRLVFGEMFGKARMPLLYDVSHNTCKMEEHWIDGKRRELFVHRKGATRALGPGHPDLPLPLRAAGQPVLVGGEMGAGAYVLAGTSRSETLAFSSVCHSAGRVVPPEPATMCGGHDADEVSGRGVLVRGLPSAGSRDDVPGTFRDVTAVVEAADAAGLARKVARLRPVICIRG